MTVAELIDALEELPQYMPVKYLCDNGEWVEFDTVVIADGEVLIE
jgi:hypothetical protein